MRSSETPSRVAASLWSPDAPTSAVTITRSVSTGVGRLLESVVKEVELRLLSQSKSCAVKRDAFHHTWVVGTRWSECSVQVMLVLLWRILFERLKHTRGCNAVATTCARHYFTTRPG